MDNLMEQLGFSQHELGLIEDLKEEMFLSDIGLLRQALRVYQVANHMRKKGYTMKFYDACGIEYNEYDDFVKYEDLKKNNLLDDDNGISNS